MYKIEIPGNPVTKKNSQRIAKDKNGKPHILQSKQYTAYEVRCLNYLKRCKLPAGLPIHEPVTITCRYFMKSRRRVDLVNLIEATMDILVRAGILADDNSSIVTSHDGSRVMYDEKQPRAAIYIFPESEFDTLVQFKNKNVPRYGPEEYQTTGMNYYIND